MPARRRTSGGDPLDALVRLFLLQDPVDARTTGLPTRHLLAAGLVEEAAGELRAVLDVRPYAEPEGPDWWVVSDLGTGL
ncbi:MAG TPA: SAM-dependent methyltransferase, partial [Lapillicoccus sp.]|nr:SAM-dependent methyltransferase [Lapillicoccus sp.]